MKSVSTANVETGVAVDRNRAMPVMARDAAGDAEDPGRGGDKS